MHKNNLITFIMVFLVMIIAGCGGGGGKGSSSDNKTSISGTISAPSGVAPSSLTVVSLGSSSLVSQQNNFTTPVYNDGVTVVAAMPSGKNFGLMNVVSTTSSVAATTATQISKIVAASSTSSSPTGIKLDSKTTAVSMVFLTPYLLTNDPTKAANIISIIENDPQVANLAAIINNVFTSIDPLSDPGLQQALINSVQSVLNTIAAQQSIAQQSKIAITATATPQKVLQLPKQSLSSVVIAAALSTSATPYYSYHDYITVSATHNGYNYDIKEESKNIGSVDWLAEVMKLDPAQFSSFNDFQLKASATGTLYQNERANVLGRLEAPAKSYFRFFDLIELASDSISSILFGTKIEKTVSVSSTNDGIYLIRSYSGSWADSATKTFVRGQVPSGSTMDTTSIINNLTTASLDTLSVFVDLKSIPMDIVLKAGLNVATDKVSAIAQANNPTMKDIVAVASDVLMAMFKETANNVADKSLSEMLGNVGQIIGKSLIDLPGKISSGGKVVDRIGQMLTSATAMETAIIIVGDPFSVTNTINPTIAQNPMSGAPGTTFSQWGTGFTPNSTATMHFKKPDGTEYPTASQSIDGNGTFSIIYTAPTNKPSGTYSWWVVDGPTGKISNSVNYTITNTISPTIAQTPMSAPAGTTFAQWGTGFSPNSTATLHFKKPDGTEYPTSTQSIDANGTFSISYVSPTSKAAGTYVWWAVDGPTGKISNSVSYTITINPTIAQTPMSAPAGTTFAQWGTGFSPNSTATLHFKKPDGTEYPTSTQSIDANGTFSISYVSPTSKAAGTYVWWAVDGPTGKISNSVSYTITVKPTIAQTPMSGPAGTTFAQWGTGFSPNSTSTLHFRKPDGTEYPTSAQAIDGNGTFSISYPSPSNKPSGTYTWWGVDGPTGKTSNSVSYVIN